MDKANPTKVLPSFQPPSTTKLGKATMGHELPPNSTAQHANVSGSPATIVQPWAERSLSTATADGSHCPAMIYSLLGARHRCFQRRGIYHAFYSSKLCECGPSFFRANRILDQAIQPTAHPAPLPLITGGAQEHSPTDTRSQRSETRTLWRDSSIARLRASWTSSPCPASQASPILN